MTCDPEFIILVVCLSPSLRKALWSSFGFRFALAGILKLVHDILQLTSPVFLKLIVEFIQKDGTEGATRGLLLAGLLLLFSILQSICLQNYFHMVFRTSLKVHLHSPCFYPSPYS